MSATSSQPSRRHFLHTAAAAATATGVGISAIASAQTSRHGALSGKVALVTGAARGIGRAIAEEFAKNGAAVVMLDLADPSAVPPVDGFRIANEEEFDEAFAAVRAITPDVLKIKGDVRAPADLEKAVTLATEWFGGLDIVVANAGYVRWHAFEDGTDLHWKSVYDVNVHGVFNTFRAAIPALKQRGGGRLIAISSIGGRQGVPGNGAYTSSKWAVIGLVKQAAIELGSYNIAVNAIAPGPVDTPMYRSDAQIRSMGLASREEQDAALNPLLPLGDKSVLESVEIAEAAVFLAGPSGRSVSGISLDVALGYNASYTA